MNEASTQSRLNAQKQLEGVFALLLTPFLEDGAIDWDVYDRYVDWQLGQQSAGLFAVCGSSEMGLLTLEERLKLAERAVQRAQASHTPVIATANVAPLNHLSEHEEELLRMAATGVSAIVLIPPSELGKDQELLYQYFSRLTSVSPVPVLLYECPMYRPHLIEASIYGRLVKEEGVIGIKDTTCTLEGIQGKINAGGIVYQANTPFMLDSIRNGARGIMAITSTAAVSWVQKMWDAGRRDNPDDQRVAEAIHAQLVALDALLGKAYTATAKHLVALQGIPMNTYTRSDRELSPAVAKSLEIWLQHSQLS